jgi:hypothetical protein
MKVYWRVLGMATLLLVGGGTIATYHSNAVTLKDGTTYFLNPPQLVSSATSQTGTYIWGATYYFTLRLPSNAGESLQRLLIEQETGIGQPEFNARYTEVFEGDRNNLGARVPLKQATIKPGSQSLSLIFAQPVPPGKMITVRLYPVRNPNAAGSYLYGITAFPVGEKPFGQFIGFGHIRIYDANLD